MQAETTFRRLSYLSRCRKLLVGIIVMILNGCPEKHLDSENISKEESGGFAERLNMRV